ncbi:hypothetical protein GCK32_012806 [Trichostrongylus colubriformis]|uniref:Uncharacterized protein n=1 Tax=Trichostrongylus colubriformis TaxID=6319 RepID=A0AAN8FPP8_TRICO
MNIYWQLLASKVKIQPRFHFTSESLFEFAKGYRITLYSLPKSQNRTPAVVKESLMPSDPELDYVDDQKNISQYCKTHTIPSPNATEPMKQRRHRAVAMCFGCKVYSSASPQ